MVRMTYGETKVTGEPGLQAVSPRGGGRYTEQTEEIHITVKSLILAQDER